MWRNALLTSAITQLEYATSREVGGRIEAHVRDVQPISGGIWASQRTRRCTLLAANNSDVKLAANQLFNTSRGVTPWLDSRSVPGATPWQYNRDHGSGNGESCGGGRDR
jgi:hypothetical protein